VDLFQVLDLAIQREKGSHDFYCRAAEITYDTKGIDMFVWLAQQELCHFHSLRKLEEALRKISTEVDFGCLSDEDSKIIESLPESEASGEVTTSTTALEALQIAIQAERASIELYRRAEKGTADSGTKIVFDSLVSEEQMHLLQLEDQLKAVSQSGSFAAMDQLPVELPEY